MLDLLPPEIFARVLEIAIESWGIGFLPPICRVSSTCRDVVLSTPSLWGIISIDKHSSLPPLKLQLAKAKETDLRITFSHKGWSKNSTNKYTQRLMDCLTPLAHNWVRLDLPTILLALARSADMGRLGALSLRLISVTDTSSADTFFGQDGTQSTPPNLHSFTASALPEEWTTRFLSPRITFFEIGRLRNIPAATIERYLSRTPNVHTLNLLKLNLLPLSALNTPLTLSNLHNLDVTEVEGLMPLLLDIRAPSLRTLAIRDCTGEMGPVFSQWSQQSHLPAALQRLELAHCLNADDTPFLIRWLARLPALLRLTLAHAHADELPWAAASASVETDLLCALASPHGAGPVVGGWLCPALRHLYLDVPLSLADLLPLARARGPRSEARPRGPGAPAALSSIQAHLCCSGTADELAELRSYFAEAEDVWCLCVGCSFNLKI
ncbi:hypothetical protein B0H15DRAFT_863628 [Mycena belliarum]|uniref:Uncharacterized protein n=1 Tax=Mycena belliarum TaxID=1033014 RepID=A0AAD6TS73_9AGAR|nr:hypothetical protein B0H15DRAFT_863628 [Mycena belliae]